MAKKRKRFVRYSRGGIVTPIMLLALLFLAIFLVSNTLVNKSAVNDNGGSTSPLSCCDTGSGDACKPQSGSGQTLTYNGTQYGLLRSKMTLVEGNLHLKDSGQTFNGNPIVLNSSEAHAIGVGYEAVQRGCNRPDPIGNPKDLYFKKNPSDPYILMRTAQPESVIAEYCASVPNDELIFVCKENCIAAACTYPVTPKENISCYGTDKSVFDVYYRLADQTTNGVPDFVKNCDTSNFPTGAVTGTQQKIVTPTYQAGKKDNLQLKTFQLEQENLYVPWLSPLCKPAIYLYPENITPVHVAINPVGPIKLTIPSYPAGGWNVIANPDGTVVANNKIFDYLYYEAEIPDEKIEKPTDGYVVEKGKLAELLSTILPKLGLNQKEESQFIEYWANVVPDARYYFVGIVPVSNLDSISPLFIAPKPQTSIRVTLYFEPLDAPISVNPPKLLNTARRGFTMVEWGGIFKKSAKYPFSCFQ